MLNFDAGKLAKDAVQGLQKAEKLGGGAGAAAKSVLQGVKSAEKLAGIPDKNQIIEALRKLLAEAKAKAGKNKALDDCIEKAQTMLEGDVSPDAAVKLTAELGALLKAAGTHKQEDDQANQDAKKAANTPAAAAVRSAPAPAQEKAAPAPQKTVQFSDVDAGAYYYDAVQWAVNQGIASGTTETTFSPDQNCTRAQTITLLWRAAGSPAPKSQNNPFTDVKDTAYYRDAALWAAERGIVSGSAFEPDNATTRAQLAAFLYRDAGSPAVRSGNDFTDVPSDADYCQAVAWVAEKGITSGTGEHTFSPDNVCTRGQIVTFLYRARK